MVARVCANIINFCIAIMSTISAIGGIRIVGHCYTALTVRRHTVCLRKKGTGCHLAVRSTVLSL